MNSLNTTRARLIGSPKLQIIFHKRATKYTSLLWKMTYKDKGLYSTRHGHRVLCEQQVLLGCWVVSDGDLVERLHDKFKAEVVKVWLDKRCLSSRDME